MRRFLFAAIASIALMAAVPASSMAKSHHHRSSHHRRSHRVRTQTRRFGDVNAPATPTTTPSSMDAGTVASFTPNSTNTGGTLVITVKNTDGSTSDITGLVTPDTQLECLAMNSQVSGDDGGPGPSGSGDQGDNGDRGDNGDSGDDNGNDANNNNDNDANENGQACMSALVMGAVVRDATLRISSAGSTWDRVELDS
jgi:hypothetical protein